MKRPSYIESFVITILIFVIIWLFSIIPYKLIFLDPLAKAVGDFDLNDIVFSRLSPEHELDTNIVLVNIGKLSRAEIAEQLNVINSFQPKVVGIDAIFPDATTNSNDEPLRKAFNNTKKLVLVGILDKYNEDGDFYGRYIEPAPIFRENSIYGYANLPTKYGASSKTIRSFRPYSKVNANIVPAFSVRVAELFNMNAYQKFTERGNSLEIINYRGNIDKFYTLETDFYKHDNIDLSFVKDKIVLMGFLGNSLREKILDDIYFTPLNEVYAGRSYPDMYGVAVHANIISMILDEDFIDTVPMWISAVLAFCVCFINVVYIRIVRRRLTDYYGGIAKIIIFVQTVLILIINTYLLLIFKYKMSFTLLLIGLIFIPSTVILYDNLIKHLVELFNQKFILRKKS
jgi:CHASE2 domain-containing sensor protein